MSTSYITPAWALRDPEGALRRSRTSTGALWGPGWTTSSSPGFPDMVVDLTADADEEDLDEAPATPSPNVSEDDSSAEMQTDEEEDILGYHGLGHDGDSSSDDGFGHI